MGLQGLLNHVRARPGRMAVQIIAIALGVALGLAVHLIHASALDSFAAGVRQFSGTADRIVRGPKNGFELGIADRLLQVEGLQTVSPVVEMDIAVEGIDKPVKWLGLDYLRAAAVTPNLLGNAEDGDDLFDSHAVFLSPALARRLNRVSGQTLTAEGPAGPVHWRVAGLMTGVGGEALIALSDIAAAQWRFGLGDRIHRIDIKADEGLSGPELERRLSDMLRERPQAGLWLDNPDDAGSRGAAVSRAYRVNLTILALVALLTGGFLVYASQTLAALERRRQWALLSALGADPALIRAQILTEASMSGLIGSLAGMGLGILAASAVLRFLGADLGSGFFQGTSPHLQWTGIECLLFVLLGLGCSLAGAWKPARDASSTPGIAALRASITADDTPSSGIPRAGLLLLGFSPVLALLPPCMGLPLGGYAGIASGLAGGIACMPALLQALTPAPAMPRNLQHVSALRTRHSPGHSGIALAGIVASFSLVVAMAIMVNSFRESLSEWLDDVLPAPLYLRIQAGDLVSIDEALQKKLSTLPGIERAEFWTSLPVPLSPDRPAPALVVRPINTLAPQERLPLVDAATTRFPPETTPVWVTEAMVSLYGWQQGSLQRLPLPGVGQQTVFVAGIWRDYARQQGAIVMDVAAARNAGLALQLTDAAFWPAADTSVGEISNRLRDALATTSWASRVEFAEAQFIRDISLRIFDRSFAITYLLEAAAIGIGLLGIATTFGATALSRRHEFAALSAMGADTAAILRMLLAEGLQVAWVGVGVGLAMGFGFSLILIHVVNPQSFNWTMGVHLPLGLLAVLALTLVSLASLTAVVAGWSVLRQRSLDILKAEHG